MVKTAVDVEAIVRRFVTALEAQIDVERVILTGDYAQNAATDDSDIWLLVISPNFEGKNILERTDILGMTAFNVDILIQAWGFSPQELDRTVHNSGGDMFLGMMLNQSREIYTAPQLTKMQEDGHD